MTERNSSRFLLLLNKNKQNHLAKMMESSYHMALSDRARNYEARIREKNAVEHGYNDVYYANRLALMIVISLN